MDSAARMRLLNLAYAALKAAGLKAAISKTIHGHYTVVRAGFVCGYQVLERGLRVHYEFSTHDLRYSPPRERGPEYRREGERAAKVLSEAGFNVEMQDDYVVLIPFEQPAVRADLVAQIGVH